MKYLVSTVLVVALAVAFVWAVSLNGKLEATQRAAKMQAQTSERNIAEKDRTIANLKRRLDQMTKRYEEEYADRAAVMDYLAGIQRKMDFAHPERDPDAVQAVAEGLVLAGIGMAFAKISGVLEPEEPFKDEKGVLAEYKARLDEDFKKNPYPFAVSNRVWMEEGRLNFEIVDVDMMRKMEKREQRSLKESLDMMKAYRVTE